MTHRLLRSFLSTAVVASGLLIGSTALAHKTVSVRLHNDTNDTPMTCKVHKVVTRSNGTSAETLLRTYNVKPKNQRPDADRNKPQNFALTVKYIIKRINGSVVYPKLKLTCKLQTGNNENSSPLWDNNDKSFSQYRLFGSCRSGAYCSTRIQRK